jgi:SAM-dependent methyltransferase
MGIFNFIFGGENLGPFTFYRAFFTSEVIRDGDVILDIGCGDGTFTKKFYSPRCAKVLAIDIDRSAIRQSRRSNSAPNIEYRISDAVSEPFPGDAFDVIILDGSLGHFSANGADILLLKIANAIKENGIFAGSESLGVEGHDHLQYFNSLEDLYNLLKKSFRFIQLRSISYRIGGRSGYIRHEAFWRCANSRKRLDESAWKEYS